MSFETMRQLARYTLRNRMDLPAADWTVQGFGFLRLRISDTLRLHVWDSRLRQAGVSDIHDHAQWAFTSTVLSGRIVNVRFAEVRKSGFPHMMQTIKCGVGGGVMFGVEPEEVMLAASDPELYIAGTSYHQEPDEIHQSLPTDGTVTIIEQTRREVDTARVFWPKGTKWGDAIPRQASRSEVDEVGGYALMVFG
jgi:hypothetical protein